jgi:dynactin-4
VQLQKVNTEVETVQAQFDSLKEHLETYISLSTPVPAAKSRNISRHVSHYTQMAAKAMNKDVPTMRKPVRPAGIERPKEPVEWDDLGEYEGKGDWRQWGFEKGLEEVDYMGELSKSGWEGLSPIEARWGNSWARENQAK